MNEYDLFIDESGNSDPTSSQSNLYILLGCCIPSYKREEVKNLADCIKFKFWNKTDIVFHSREIARNENCFSIFKNNRELKDKFLEDLLSFLKKIPIVAFAIVIDKSQAKKLGWNQNKVLKETARHLIYHFIAFLLSNHKLKGKIIIESATSQKDIYFLNSFLYFLSPGFTELGVDYQEIRKRLTSISFVTKDNFDIEEQTADLLAYAAKCKFQRNNKKTVFEKNSYEDKIISILEQKLFIKPLRAKERKMKFFEKIDPFCILPK